jgi:hypothetical protein
LRVFTATASAKHAGSALRRATVTALVALAIAALAGCGGGGSTSQETTSTPASGGSLGPELQSDARTRVAEEVREAKKQLREESEETQSQDEEAKKAEEEAQSRSLGGPHEGP